MSFGERIKEYIVYKRMSIRAFEIECSLKNGALSRVVKKNTSLNGESIASIARTWKELNINWLMTGDGEMLKPLLMVNEPANQYMKDGSRAKELQWSNDSLRRADEQIELQKELIASLNRIIELQVKTAKDKGIDL